MAYMLHEPNNPRNCNPGMVARSGAEQSEQSYQSTPNPEP